MQKPFSAIALVCSLTATAAIANMNGRMSGSSDSSSNAPGQGAVSEQPGQVSEQTSTSTSTGKSDQQQMSLDKFRKAHMLNHLHHINQKEIRMARMAADKSESPEVKSAAQQMIQDHQQWDKRVQDMAKSDKVALQDVQLATHERATMDQLRKLNGKQFDQAYLDSMRMGHQMVLSDLRIASKETQDPKLRALIDETIPGIEKHNSVSQAGMQGMQSDQQQPESQS